MRRVHWPSHGQWGKREGLKLPDPGQLHSKFRERVCRWCLSPLETRARRSWCSERCSSMFSSVSTWANLRRFIMERDKVCQRCGTDSPGWNPGAPIVHVFRDYFSPPVKCVDLLPWWEIDHIRPISDGGNDHPENLRLLCHHCHVEVGVKQRAEIRERRRQERYAAAQDDRSGGGYPL